MQYNRMHANCTTSRLICSGSDVVLMQACDITANSIEPIHLFMCMQENAHESPFEHMANAFTTHAIHCNWAAAVMKQLEGVVLGLLSDKALREIA